MDGNNNSTKRRCRPEFEVTRTCDLLSRLAEEAENEDASGRSNREAPDSAPEDTPDAGE